MKKTKKDTFHAAILRSLRALVDSGEVITNTAVIENAKYLDGRQVGKSTLYSLKRGQKGVYVHSDLLVTLDTARDEQLKGCLLYTSPSPRDRQKSRMPSSA